MTELIEDLDTITKLESDSLALTLAPCNIIDTCKRPSTALSPRP